VSAGELEGGCLCGAVRYRAAGEPSHPTLCHCDTCRHATGAPLVAWLTFARSDFGFTRGEPMRYRSSPPVERTFCGRCGTPLTYARDDERETIDVTTGSFDRAADLAPRDHTWTMDSLPWIWNSESLPRFPRRRSDGRE
jgi:hypothetical protein